MELNCPCCGTTTQKEVLLSKALVPALNNRVYDTIEKAKAASSGAINLIFCSNCHYAFNVTFDPDIVDYENGYDAGRGESQIYVTHEDEVANWCASDLDHTHHILEIGCGEGSFLDAICNITQAAGIGFEPSAPKNSIKDRVKIFCDQFTGIKPGDDPFDVVILRHVLEHISNPRQFVMDILANGTLGPGGRIVIEVPDLDWILNNQSAFDITYEHCGYFTRRALNKLFNSIGFVETKFHRPFGGQYLLMEAKPRLEEKSTEYNSTPGHLKKFQGLKYILENWHSRLAKYKNIIIWGASGKGVIFLSDLDEESLKKIAFLVDINTKKTNYYTPVTGKIIMTPDYLSISEQIDLVIIINPVYENEIQYQLGILKTRAEIVTAQELATSSGQVKGID